MDSPVCYSVSPKRLNHRQILAVSLLVLLLPQPLPAQPSSPPSTQFITGQVVASPEPGWPQFRGPRRDGISDETGLMKEWPVAGPKLKWTVAGLGYGYSSPIFWHNQLFLTGDTNELMRILALDPAGRIVWRATNGAGWKNPYPGSRAHGTLHQGRLFNLNAHGRLACLDPVTGKEHWSVNILERFGGKNLTWAISECVVGDRDHIIVTPGGSRALMAALSVETGDTVWMTEPLQLSTTSQAPLVKLAEPAGAFDSASYASPLLVDWGGRRLLIHCSLRHVFGVDADTGKLLWSRPFDTRYSVIAAMPVWCGDGFFVTAPDTDGGHLYRLIKREGIVDVQEAWTTPLDTCHGGVVKVDQWLYGSWYRRHKGWACVDANTGKVAYQASDWPMGSVLYADQRLYCLNQDGIMLLMEPTPNGFQVRGQFPLVAARVTDAWAHPVIFQGNLYLRYHDTLFCYDIHAP